MVVEICNGSIKPCLSHREDKSRTFWKKLFMHQSTNEMQKTQEAFGLLRGLQILESPSTCKINGVYNFVHKRKMP